MQRKCYSITVRILSYPDRVALAKEKGHGTGTGLSEEMSTDTVAVWGHVVEIKEDGQMCGQAFHPRSVRSTYNMNTYNKQK